MSALKGIILFTAVETIGLVVWLVLAGVPFSGKYLAVVVLAAALFVEHLVAYNVGTGRSFFSIPK